MVDTLFFLKSSPKIKAMLYYIYHILILPEENNEDNLYLLKNFFPLALTINGEKNCFYQSWFETKRPRIVGFLVTTLHKELAFLFSAL